MDISPNWLFIFLGLTAILIELVVGISTGFDLVLLGLSLVLGGVVGELIGNWLVGLVAASLLSVSYILLGRRFIKNKFAIATKKTNIDSLIGHKTIVTKEISHSKAGQVKINGEVWRAEADDNLRVGDRVIVKEIEGVSLRVIKI